MVGKICTLLASLLSFQRGLLAETESYCSSKPNCRACVAISNIEKCAWCPRQKICHRVFYKPDPPCYEAEVIDHESHCDDELAHYDPELSDKMLLLSAAAYDESNKQLCLSNILPSSEFEMLEVVTRNCDPGALFTVTKCSGFVAISHIENTVVLGFRGSTGVKQASVIVSSVLSHPKVSFNAGGEVQLYFERAFRELWRCLKRTVISAISNHPSYQLWVTGHSLGGALASLASAWIVYYGIIPRKNITLYTFGMPRVGNEKYAKEHDKLVNNSFRVVNYDDPVTHMPTQSNIKKENDPHHHGVEVFYSEVAKDAKKSLHRECYGKPFNEDQTCSFPVVENFLTEGDLDNHKEYFGIPVGTYWKEGCSGRRGRRELSENVADNTANQSLVWKAQCTRYKFENGSLVLVNVPYEKNARSARSSSPRGTTSLFTYWPIFMTVYIWSIYMQVDRCSA